MDKNFKNAVKYAKKLMKEWQLNDGCIKLDIYAQSFAAKKYGLEVNSIRNYFQRKSLKLILKK